MQPSLDDRKFASPAEVDGGDVGAETVFEYHEASDGMIWARYSGGKVQLGFLVGSRSDNTLDFRYAHLDENGSTATGHCTSTIESDSSGRLVLNESWEWESKAGKGNSVLVELVR